MDLPITVTLALLFTSVATATGVLFWYLTEPQTAKRRLTEVVSGGGSSSAPQASVIAGGASAAVKRARTYLPKSPKEMNRIQRMMVSAGYESEWASFAYAAVQLALPVAVFLAGLLNFGTSASVLVFSGLAAILAYYVPTLWLGRQIEQRRTEIRNGLPDAIDLLIVCIESGSGVDQALARVGEELAIAYPPLSRELLLISAETRAGTPRIQAFKNFADRTRVDDVRSLVTMLVQTDRFGTSLGQALRTHSEVSRTKRRQRAEEKAAKLGVKLLFPLVFCLFPAFYVIVIGPAIVMIYRQFITSP
jgi:tight adherence protein C